MTFSLSKIEDGPRFIVRFGPFHLVCQIRAANALQREADVVGVFDVSPNFAYSVPTTKFFVTLGFFGDVVCYTEDGSEPAQIMTGFVGQPVLLPDDVTSEKALEHLVSSSMKKTATIWLPIKQP